MFLKLNTRIICFDIQSDRQIDRQIVDVKAVSQLLKLTTYSFLRFQSFFTKALLALVSSRRVRTSVTVVMHFIRWVHVYTVFMRCKLCGEVSKRFAWLYEHQVLLFPFCDQTTYYILIDIRRCAKRILKISFTKRNKITLMKANASIFQNIEIKN